MLKHRPRRVAFFAVLSLVAGVPGAFGQPGGASPSAPAVPVAAAPPDAPVEPVRPPWFDGTLEQALARATGTSRPLLLVIAATPQRQKEEDARWSNPALAAWAERHAVLVRVTDAAKARTLADGMLRMAAGDDPFVFKGSKSVRVFGSAWSPEGQRAVRLKGPGRPTDTFAGLVIRLEWTRRAMVAADPAWGAAHAAAIGAPPPQLPPTRGDAPPVAHAIGAWLAAPAPDRVAPERLRGALSLVCNDEAARAILQPALLSVAAAEAQSRAKADPAARAGYLSLARSLLARTDWSDAWSAWRTLTLLRVVDRHVENLALLSAALDDTDSRPAMVRTGPEPDAPTRPVPAMLATADRVILELALPRMHLRTDLVLNADVAGRVAGLLADAAKPAPGGEAGGWQRVQAFRRELAAFEAARGYAALLAAGRDEDAARVLAALAGPGAGDGRWQAGARLGCIVAAIAHEQRRPAMRELIAADAKALGIDAAPLQAAASEGGKP